MIGAAEIAAPPSLSPPVSPLGSLTATGSTAPAIQHGPSRGNMPVRPKPEPEQEPVSSGGDRAGVAVVRAEVVQPHVAQAEVKPAIAAQPTAKAATPAAPVSGEVAAIWAKVVRAGGEQSPLLRAVLTNMTLISLTPTQATIAVDSTWAARAAKWTTQVAELIGKQTGQTVSVLLQSPLEGVSMTDVTSADGSAPAAPAVRPNVSNATDHPLVKTALELFGGRVVDVQPRRS